MSKKKSGGGGGGGPGFLMQQGEKVAVAACAAVAVLLLGLSLVMPGSGFFSGNPDEKADALKNTSQQVLARLNDPNNKPTDNDKPPRDSDKKRVALDTVLVKAENFFVDGLVPIGSGTPAGRKVPRVYPIEEALADVGRVQFLTYILTERDGEEYIAMLKAPAAKSVDGKGLTGKLGGAGVGRGKGAGGGGMMGMAGGGGMRGGGLAMPGTVTAEDDSKREKVSVFVKVSELESKAAGHTPAVQIRPHRVAVIAASFPFRKQVEEFRARLALRTNSEVLNEASREKTKDGKPLGLAAFRFKGVNVQRRELDGNGVPIKEAGPDGKPLGEWRQLDLAESYREFIRAAGQDFEKDDPELTPVSYTGLVMHKLKQFRPEEHNLPAVHGSAMPGMMMPPPGGRGRMGGMPPMGGMMPPMGGMRPPMGGDEAPTAETAKSTPSQYPAVEKNLPLLKQTLDKLKGKKPAEVAAPSRFSGVALDPFGVPQPPAAGGGTETTPEAPASTDLELPEHCLVRIIDVDVAPGRIYEYRLQIRMANPNLFRPDVANPHYADPDDGKNVELLSDWSAVPIRVAVARELIYYAADQKVIDEAPVAGKREKYAGPNTAVYPSDKVLVLQAHRWLKDFRLGTGGSMIIGDWAVAERLPVYRGEYIGRRIRVEMPVWRYQRETYVMTTDDNIKKGNKGLPIPFGFEEKKAAAPEAILVDFEPAGGRGHSDARKVADTAAAQALILSPDGKLLLREGALDTFDQERVNRLEDFRKRIKEVKKKSEKGGSALGGMGETPR